MEVLTAPLRELAEFEEGKTLSGKREGRRGVHRGLYDSQKLHMIYGLSDGFDVKIIVTFSDKRARKSVRNTGSMTAASACTRPGSDLLSGGRGGRAADPGSGCR